MSRGRQTRRLTPDQVQRLEKFRRECHDGAPHGYSFAQLRTAIGASFSPETMQKALQGLAVWDLHHSYIVSWIERYLGKEKPAVDGKALASGERNENGDGETEADRTTRGSR